MELSAQGFYFDAAAVMYSLLGHESIGESVIVSLPEPTGLHMDVGEAMRLRRSRSEYSGEPLAFGDLATLLWCASGITGRGEVEHLRGGRTFVHLRTTPSGGALYSIEQYVAILNSEGTARGIYRYEALRHRLLGFGDCGTVDQLLRAFCFRQDQATLERAGAIFLMIARPWRTMRKYGPRGLRHVFLEAGYIAQNIHLACISLGLGSIDCSSFYDDEVHEALRIDGVYETIVHAVIVGHPAAAP